MRALTRSRLDEVGTRLREQRFVLVVAPAGFGKTTLLGQFAAAAEGQGPVAWYRADAGDTTPAAVLAHLEQAVVAAVPSVPAGWATVADASAALDTYEGPHALVAVDDLHALYDTAGEVVLERLVENLPPTITVVAASRRAPAFNLSRLRVSGDVLELGSEDLRFRSWEVEALFRDFYGEPLFPEELAELARRTEGWAAGLQLFHLATRGKSAQQRRGVLAALATRTRLVRDYLTANVIDELPRAVRGFLLDTCVLGRLTPELCDAVRGAGDSAQWLAELDEGQIFTQALDDGSYRYHEVLRSHLETLLVEHLGDAAVRARYRRSGGLLEEAGALPEALRAYCRAEDWDAVTRLLGGSGERAIADPGRWLALLPASLLDHDPWLMLASARRQLADGDWSGALGRYRQAEDAFGAGPASETARRERQAVSAWLQPTPVPRPDWTGIVRLATIRDPQAVWHRAAAVEGAAGLLATGLTALLAGSARGARQCFDAVAGRDDAADAVALGAEIGAAVATLLAGASVAETTIHAACDRADRLGFPALAWIGRTAAAIDPAMSAAGRGAAPRAGAWATALDALVTSLGDLRAGGTPVARLDDAVAAFRHLGAGTLEAWARAAHAVAVARGGEPNARETALAAESFARNTGVQGALGVAYAALAEADPLRAGEYHALRKSLEDECGLDVAGLVSSTRGAPGYEALGSRASATAPFAGRTRELAGLRRVVDAACAGAGAVVDLDGDSGIGKTRLAEEVAIYAAGRGATVLWGRGIEGGPAFWPWAQILRTHLLGRDPADVEREVNGDVDALRLVVPELAELLPGCTGAAAPDVSRFTIFRAITAVMERAAARGPLVLVLDDLHVVDASSAALFDYVSKVVPELPVLLVGTRRGVVAAMAGSTGTIRVGLTGLAAPEVADLLRGIAGRSAPAVLARAVWEKTGGNPFFVHETAKQLLAEDRFDDASIVSADGVGVAAGVQDLVAGRVGALSPGAAEVLSAAAVVGRTFSLSLLERVTALDAGGTLAAVGEAVGAGLLEEAWAEAGQYMFGHALIQEAVYDRLDTVTRVRLHRRVGSAIEAASGRCEEPRLAELAHHFLRAAGDGDVEKAISYAVRAGERAIVTGAYDEAVRQCEGALALLDEAGLDDERRAELLLTLGGLRARRGSPRDVAGAVRSPRGTPSLVLRCLGRFEMSVHGRPVDLSEVKPRHRSLLRLLASRGGQAVHREQLIDALWPAEVDTRAGTRNLQVAVSTLRRILDPDAVRGGASLLAREGDAYRLVAPDDADIDVVEVERSVDDGRQALVRGDTDTAAHHFGHALATYSGDFLPEEGPVEWVIKARERLRLEVAEAAQALAQIEFDRGSPAAAAAVGERGLQVDRLRDGLWRLVIAAYERTGDAAAAARSRRAYDEVLYELGVT